MAVAAMVFNANRDSKSSAISPGDLVPHLQYQGPPDLDAPVRTTEQLQADYDKLVGYLAKAKR